MESIDTQQAAISTAVMKDMLAFKQEMHQSILGSGTEVQTSDNEALFRTAALRTESDKASLLNETA